MIDATVDDELDNKSSQTSQFCPVTSDSSSCSATKKHLADDEIVSMANLFLLAGYDTTSNTLAFASYLLALNQAKQDELCAEIDAYDESNTMVLKIND